MGILAGPKVFKLPSYLVSLLGALCYTKVVLALHVCFEVPNKVYFDVMHLDFRAYPSLYRRYVKLLPSVRK